MSPTGRGARSDAPVVRQGVVALVAILGACAAFVLALGLAFNACAASFSSAFKLPKAVVEHPQTTTPIPIPRTACPYLHRVYDAANKAEGPWLQVYASNASWKKFAVGMAFTLPPLADALTAAIPHVPKPVAVDFNQTRRNVDIGIAALRTSHSLDEYNNNRTNNALQSGVLALLDSRDLVGTACGLKPGLLLF